MKNKKVASKHLASRFANKRKICLVEQLKVGKVSIEALQDVFSNTAKISSVLKSDLQLLCEVFLATFQLPHRC